MNKVYSIEKNAKAIKTLIGILVLVCSMVYGLCVFIFQTQECTHKLASLALNVEKMKADSIVKHTELENRISLNEKNFQMTSTKLDVSLTKISADLQFIKEHLMKKGMDR